MQAQFSIHDIEPARSQPASKSNKRARLVCYRCHEKKIKCDLLSKSRGSERATTCSNCADAGCPCQLRPSNRGRRRGSVRGDEDVSITVAGLDDVAFDATLTPPEDNYIPQRSPPANRQGFIDNIGVVEGDPAPPTLVAAPVPSASAFPRPLSSHHTQSSLDSGRCHPSFIGNTGYMQMFAYESEDPPKEQRHQQPGPWQLSQVSPLDNIPPSLQEGHLDVFFEYGLTWCPIFDRATFESDPSLNQSLLLRHALALCANQIKPSLLEHSSSVEHYNRAKELFYGNHEPNPLVRVMALMLFYWWSAEPPTVVSLDTTWWWTGTAIRLAQQLGLHCNIRSSHDPISSESPGLRRRIWWTLVARERISALSQGRPCVIDLDDCDVLMPTVDDFLQPYDPIRAPLFVKWIPLCEIIGRVGKMLRRRPHDASSSAISLAQDLIAWVQSLPPALQPGIQASRTTGFNRDVHGMHLTYLSCVTILRLGQDAQPLPKVSIAAIVAASCTARIVQDYLIRGSVSFLAGQAGWYITVAILALLHGRRLEGLAINADADIRVLRSALRAMARTWHSARLFEKGIDNLMDTLDLSQRSMGTGATAPSSPSMDELSATAGIKWQDYVPYVTADTSPLIATLMAQDEQLWLFEESGWTFDFQGHLNQFVPGSGYLNLDFMSL